MYLMGLSGVLPDFITNKYFCSTAALTQFALSVTEFIQNYNKTQD